MHSDVREDRSLKWRREFAAGGTVNGVRVAGIPIHELDKPEVQSIEVGINRVFAAFVLNQILVFDDLHGFLDELQSYSRELDERGSRRRRSRRRRRFTCSTLRGMLFR